jgi:GNAT superfamily N-acetyltransferase
VNDRVGWLVASDCPTQQEFDAIYRALDADTRPVAGAPERRPLMIPVRDNDGHVAGGLWGCTLFRWLQIEMLVVPPALRRMGVGSALVAAAEHEAATRGCLGAFVDTFSFQAPLFYERLGYHVFGVLDAFPPGHTRLYFRKLFAA